MRRVELPPAPSLRDFRGVGVGAPAAGGRPAGPLQSFSEPAE